MIYTNFRVQRAVVWLRQLDLGLSPWKPKFNPWLVHVRFVVYSVTGTTGCVCVVQLSPVNITAPLVHTHHLYATLTRKTSRWKPGTFKHRYWGAMDGKVFAYCNADFKGLKTHVLESCLFPLSEPMSGITMSHSYILLSQYDDPCFTKKAEASQIQQSSLPFTSDSLLLKLIITYHMSHHLDLPLFPLTQPCHGLGRQLQAVTEGRPTTVFSQNTSVFICQLSFHLWSIFIFHSPIIDPIGIVLATDSTVKSNTSFTCSLSWLKFISFNVIQPSFVSSVVKIWSGAPVLAQE